jgi:hypothetical protein
MFDKLISLIYPFSRVSPFFLQPSYIHFRLSPIVLGNSEPSGMINSPVSVPMSIGKVHICIKIF